MTQQLELFPDLSLGLRPPRRLRVLGFDLELLERDAEGLADIKRRLDHHERQLATNVAEAKAFGHVIPNAYDCVVDIEECRDMLAEKIRDTHELHCALDRQHNRAIEKHLKRTKERG